MSRFAPVLIIALLLYTCGTDEDDTVSTDAMVTLNFTHNWDGETVTDADFSTIKFANANGEMLSIERLRYLVSDIRFSNSNNEFLTFDIHQLIDLSIENSLSLTLPEAVLKGNYTNVSFNFGFDNEDNAENYVDLNLASFNVPDMLGGGYHYMQFDGKFLNSNSEEQGFNYHAIRAVDNPGMNPTFPQDTFFTVNLGAISLTDDASLTVEMNIAEWFKSPNTWDLNSLNTVLMPNSSAQIVISENGRNVFSLGTVTQ
ncbi:hypothetical protein Q2T40_17955 [Winogradskyella maritima]|uniref:MbnP family protein n=1 Tax=Winogradskyella maritima TaxID=1517766 RepID=A0ABV8AEK5_9FLAO|nr:hypothetical protein [Winogradskyella maritima]